LAFVHCMGVPCMAPEIVLLYKSNYVKYLTGGAVEITHPFIKDYRHDFAVCQPFLGGGQRQWLKIALETEYRAGHEWLEQL
jgi:hypothetical protein